jgi:hypothetical protein
LRGPERLHQMAKHSFVSALVLFRLASHWVRLYKSLVTGRHTYRRGLSSLTVLSLIVQCVKAITWSVLYAVVVAHSRWDWL